MGVTRMSGPVYGAKNNLFSYGPTRGDANGSTALITSVIVPPYETWYLTELHVANSQTSSNSSTPKVILKVKGTSTSVTYPTFGPDPNFDGRTGTTLGNAGTAATFTGGTSTGAFSGVVTCSVTPGEYEGYAAPANSSIRIVSSGTIGALSVNVAGYRRYLDSTRAV